MSLSLPRTDSDCAVHKAQGGFQVLELHLQGTSKGTQSPDQADKSGQKDIHFPES